jgi:hypothetical protein
MSGNAKFLQKISPPGSRGTRMRETAPQTRVEAPRLTSRSGTGAPSAPDGAGTVQALQRMTGNQAVMRMLDIQRAPGDLREPSNETIRAAAVAGVRTPSTSLPYLDRIQASFGHHSIGDVQAHVGSAAARASQAMNAQAYATGNHVVFGARPDLRTAAHEAAHIVQQRAGVQLAGGVGRVGDRYERHAEAVADAVVAGNSVERLIEPLTTNSGGVKLETQGTTSQPGIQRLKKGDFKGLEAFGLDVGDFTEFSTAAQRLSLYELAVVSSYLRSITDTNLDIQEAINRIDEQKARLRQERPEPTFHYGKLRLSRTGGNATTGVLEKAKNEPQRQIVVRECANTTIKSATDLLVWLVSNPIPASEAPVSFARPALLTATLTRLWNWKREGVEPHEVWHALKVEEQRETEGEQKRDEMKWEEGEWETKVSRHTGFEETVPKKYRRKMPQEAYQVAMFKLKKELSGYKFVGVHATRIESTGALVKHGVSSDRFGKNHGVGKGPGLYIIPTTGDVAKDVKSAAFWDHHFVAVYLPEKYTLIDAKPGEDVETLENDHEEKNHYYRFADEEAVIPPSLLESVKLVSDPADISMADSKYEAEVDNEPPLEFLKSFSNMLSGKAKHHKNK